MSKNLRKQFSRDTNSNSHCDSYHYKMDLPSFNTHALQVLNGLHQANFKAYLVGGCVRDSLLGLTPKDFDIVTDATPPQVHKVFRRSRIIGRRFRIVHVLYGRETIEVSTFRSGQTPHRSKNNSISQNKLGRLTRDNSYGTIEEDALRRDLTANSLYYDHEQQLILDFCGGVTDIESGQLNIIGDPEQRFREDPVRMIRCIRFAAKLGMTLNEKTREAIVENSSLLLEVSPMRLFDESVKLLTQGKSSQIVQSLYDFGFLALLFPAITPRIADSDYSKRCWDLLDYGLETSDARIAKNQKVSTAYLFSFLLWNPFERELSAHKKSAIPFAIRLDKAWGKIIRQTNPLSIPKYIANAIKEIWELQYLMTTLTPENSSKILKYGRFRAAHRLLALRAMAGEPLSDAIQWWSRYQQQQAAIQKSSKSFVNKKKNKAPHRGKRKVPN